MAVLQQLTTNVERLGAEQARQGAQLQQMKPLLDSINRDVGSVAETAVRVASVLASSATYPAHRAFRTGGAGHTGHRVRAWRGMADWAAFWQGVSIEHCASLCGGGLQ
jgi:hypothetical protein